MKKLLFVALALSMWTSASPVLAEEQSPPVTPAPQVAPAAQEPAAQPVITELSYTRKSPLLAGVLSIVPGLGQVYNEEYFTGSVAFATEVTLYMAAIAYAGWLDPAKENRVSFESAFFFALAGGIHLLCIFDASLEASRRNENLDKFSVAYNPGDRGFMMAYRFDF
jgi:hypothetical protein